MEEDCHIPPMNSRTIGVAVLSTVLLMGSALPAPAKPPAPGHAGTSSGSRPPGLTGSGKKDGGTVGPACYDNTLYSYAPDLHGLTGALGTPGNFEWYLTSFDGSCSGSPSVYPALSIVSATDLASAASACASVFVGGVVNMPQSLATQGWAGAPSTWWLCSVGI